VTERLHLCIHGRLTLGEESFDQVRLIVVVQLGMPGHRGFEREIADIVLVNPQGQFCLFRLLVEASRSIERASDQRFRYAMVYDEIEADVLQCGPKFGGDLGQGAWGAGTIIAEIDNRNFTRRDLGEW
jgi:hypothetical protein